MKKCLVLGASGFLGGHIAHRLIRDGNKVTCVHRGGLPEVGGEFHIHADMLNEGDANSLLGMGWDEVYQFAGDVGGSGYARACGNDYMSMTGNVAINMHVIKNQAHYGKVFFPSSAWVYPKQIERCSEYTAYPPNPASIYGWEKLTGEMLYGALGCKAVVARTHNVYGPRSTFQGIKALAPAALCHQAITTPEGGIIKIYGSGFQERSFLYVEDYVDCVIKLMRSDCQEVVNIGSEESIPILDLALKVIEISGKDIRIELGSETVEVARRFSDNGMLERYVDWEPKTLIRDGLQKTYDYVRSVCTA